MDGLSGGIDKAALLDLLDKLPVAECSYEEWLLVGMALHHEGLSCSTWDEWSKDDPRYNPGECSKKWATFGNPSGKPVTGASIVMLAQQHGHSPALSAGSALGWNDSITVAPSSSMRLCSTWGNTTGWDAAGDAAAFLSALFRENDIVCYCVNFHGDATHPKPGKVYFKKAGDLEAELEKYSDVRLALGDNDEFGGALIYINPLDGNGRKNDNVVDFRHVLVESDEGTIDEQLEAIRKANIPCRTLVYSGGKSIHAVVAVDAREAKEYRERAAIIYDACEEAGLKVDRANKNPSRASRLPGFLRNGKAQSLIATHVGAPSWDEWIAWRESQNDDMPPTINLANALANLPELADELISGILRQGHKMILAGPSKAGKTFLLIELSICIAEGLSFLGHQCKQGKVLYINLEVDERSCQHRFNDVYKALGIEPLHASNIDTINLRGHAQPLEKLATKIILRALNQGNTPESGGYSLVVIDPIYKVIMGDENSATDIAAFCNAIDMLCTVLGCSVAYVHHHSKGVQGFKSSIDRSSGSGVFARDPDAILDISPLNAQLEQLRAAFEPLVWDEIEQAADSAGIAMPSRSAELNDAIEEVVQHLADDEADELRNAIAQVYGAQIPTAWRVSATLREFATPPPFDIWFRHPIHIVDEGGVLADCRIPGEPAVKGDDTSKAEALEDAFATASCGGDAASIKSVASIVGKSEKTIQRWIDKNPKFERKNGQMILLKDKEDE